MKNKLSVRTSRALFRTFFPHQPRDTAKFGISSRQFERRRAPIHFPPQHQPTCGTDMSRMLQQYRDVKTLHQGILVLFRNADFYELFEDDAELGSKVLGLTLTKRDSTVPMTGVAVH